MDFDRKIKRMKAAAWRYLVARIELKKLASVKRADEIDRQIADGGQSGAKDTRQHLDLERSEGLRLAA